MAFVSAPFHVLHPAGVVASNCSSFFSKPPRGATYMPTCSVATRVPARMPPQCSDMGLSFPESKFDESFRIGVVSTRWNPEYVGKMLADVKETLAEKGVKEENVVLMHVPGSFELPMAARLMCAAQKVDAVICLGVLIKGETDHYEYIANACSSGLMDLQLTLSIPMIFGVLCCLTKEQAAARSVGDQSHAKEWALTAIEMAQLRKSQLGGVSSGKKSVGFF